MPWPPSKDPDDYAGRGAKPRAGAGAYAGDEGATARGWRLTKVAWRLVRRDRTMLVLGLGGALATAAGLALFFLVSGWFRHPQQTTRLLWALVFTWPVSFVATFFNVALAAAGAAALDGQRLSLRAALAVSLRRLPQIVAWSLLAAGVGAFLETLASRVPLGGRIAGWIVGAAWAVVAFLAVPVLALEGRGPLATVRRSGGLLRTRWGEGVTGSVAIGAWLFVGMIPVGLAFGIGGALIGDGTEPAGAVLVGVGAALFVGASALAQATQQLFAVSVYRFAAGDGVSGGFAPEDVAAPFRRPWL